MDQAPRSAFLSLVVRAEERTAVMGIVNILKTLSQSGGPWVTGVLAGRGHFWVAFVAAGSLKAAYDILLLVLFAGKVRERDDGIDELGDGEDVDVVGNPDAESDGHEEEARHEDAVKSGHVANILTASEASLAVTGS
jgi:hypothetical protein